MVPLPSARLVVIFSRLSAIVGSVRSLPMVPLPSSRFLATVVRRSMAYLTSPLTSSS